MENKQGNCPSWCKLPCTAREEQKPHLRVAPAMSCKMPGDLGSDFRARGASRPDEVVFFWLQHDFWEQNVKS